MSKRNIENRNIEITEHAFNKIMAYSQALDEVVFLTCGKGNLITEVIRLTNFANAPRNHFCFSRKEEQEAHKKIRLMNLDAICMGHSHPNINHLNRPSKMDFVYLPKGTNQIIVFPIQNKIQVWKFKKSYMETIKDSYEVLIYAKNS